jgi:hypothetical protein
VKLRPQHRCPFCWKLYRADPRTRTQQKCCGREDCQKKRHAEADRRWREHNPDYDAGRRLRELQRRVQAAGGAGEVLRHEPEPGRRLPVAELQDAIGVQGLVILAFFARLLGRHAQDTIRSQLGGSPREIRNSPRGAAQDATAGSGFG